MISERLKQLRAENNLTQTDLATILGIAKTTLAAYEQKRSEPSNEIILKIARYFNVSTDYLLGLTDIKNIDPTISYISNYLGLTECSITVLHDYVKIIQETNNLHVAQKLKILNMFFQPHCELLEHISDYIHFSATHFKKFSDPTTNSLTPISDLELWDDVSKTSYSDDWDLWSKALLIIIEEELIRLRYAFQNEKATTKKEHSEDI